MELAGVEGSEGTPYMSANDASLPVAADEALVSRIEFMLEKSAVFRRLCRLLPPPPPVRCLCCPLVEKGEAASELSSLLLLCPCSPVCDADDGPGDARLWRTSATLKPLAVCLYILAKIAWGGYCG